MQQIDMPIIQYEKVNKPYVNLQGEEYDYIMEDKIVVNLPCCTFSFTICSMFQAVIGLAIVGFMVNTLILVIKS